MADLDSLLDSLATSGGNPAAAPPKSSAPSATAPSIAPSKPKVVTSGGDYEDTLDSDDEEKPKAPVAKKYAAPVAAAPPDSLTAEDLDSLVEELESQGRRRVPPTGGLQVLGARKTTARKQVKGALDGDDLERIIDEINGHARRALQQQQATEKLGFGVINAERKFDLRCPKFAIVGASIEATLFVYTQSGERSRIPAKHLKVSVGGVLGGQEVTLIDQKDGTYTMRFKAPKEGMGQLHLEAYEQPQFAWDVEVLSEPVAAKCQATANPGMRVGQTGSCTIVARDKDDKQLKVGGAQFGLTFNGAGQLAEVSLVDRLDGSYHLSFVPSKVGQYAIFITLDGEDIGNGQALIFNVA